MKRRFLRKILWILTSVLLLGIVALVSFFFAVKWGAFGPLPDKEELKDLSNATATLVYSSDQKMIGKIFDENRTNTSFEDLPEGLLHALVATEDARFYDHDGVDGRSMLRVLFKSILLQDESAGGGSTLSQQLAKNLFGRRNFSFLTLPVNKFKEIILANRLEDLYSKNEILELYLNTVPFSENTYGIEVASSRFFSKTPSGLGLEEAAVLVGMLKANTYYNPRLYPEHARDRRNVVLAQMNRYDFLDENSLDSLKALPLVLNYNRRDEDSYVPYFMNQIKKRAQELVEGEASDKAGTLDLERDGLKIYTTLNFEMQQAADAAIIKHMSKLQKLFERHWQGQTPWGSNKRVFEDELLKSRSYKNLKAQNLSEDSIAYYLDRPHPIQVYATQGDTVFNMSIRDSIAYYIKLLNCGFLAMEPTRGEVLAWSGGLSHRFMPYDHVLAHRQSASTFKPIVFATALSQGIGPCDYISNAQKTYEEYNGWTPGNYDDKYGGFYSMRGALSKSVNVATVQTLFDAGLSNVLVMARQLGIDSKLPSDPSVALGTASVSLYGMVKAYSAFANGGYAVKPYFIDRIEKANGEVVYQHPLEEGEHRVLQEDDAAMINDMLRSVVNQGTATRIRYAYGITNDLAGKTGTAQNYSDGWFIGYNPNLVVGVWVGASSPLVHFRNGTYGSGSAMALPIFGEFFKTINRSSSLNLYTKISFEELSEELKQRMDCPDFREENIFDSFFELFGDKEGQKSNDRPNTTRSNRNPYKDKKNFFDRIFKKKR